MKKSKLETFPEIMVEEELKNNGFRKLEIITYGDHRYVYYSGLMDTSWIYNRGHNGLYYLQLKLDWSKRNNQEEMKGGIKNE